MFQLESSHEIFLSKMTPLYGVIFDNLKSRTELINGYTMICGDFYHNEYDYWNSNYLQMCYFLGQPVSVLHNVIVLSLTVF